MPLLIHYIPQTIQFVLYLDLLEDMEYLVDILRYLSQDYLQYLKETGKEELASDSDFEDFQKYVENKNRLIQTEEDFEKPEWLGNEVTGDFRFYNSFLIKNPYKNWS